MTIPCDESKKNQMEQEFRNFFCCASKIVVYVLWIRYTYVSTRVWAAFSLFGIWFGEDHEHLRLSAVY